MFICRLRLVKSILCTKYITSDLGLGFNSLHTKHAESPRSLQGTPSGADHMASNAGLTQDKNQQRWDRDKARRDSLTPEQRKEMNARRRAARQIKTNEERNASQRGRQAKSDN